MGAEHSARTQLGVGERKIVPYEAPEGRRVNVVGAFFPLDPAGPSLVFESRCKDEGKYDDDAHVRFVYKLAGLPPVLPERYRWERPCVIASAILDRLLHFSHVFLISGPSYRMKGKLTQDLEGLAD